MSGATLAVFKGTAKVVRRPQSALSFAIEGTAAELTPDGDAGQKLILGFTRAPERVSGDSLTDLHIESQGEGRYRLRASEGVFDVADARHFLHRDAGPAFYRVLPPFSVPWTKRALWRVLLILARLKP